jgi:hypothetical protein
LRRFDFVTCVGYPYRRAFGSGPEQAA